MKSKLFAALLLMVMAVSGSPAAAQDHHELTVFAAASLTDAFSEIGDAFSIANPDVSVIFNFGGSSTLAAQLGQGAPADLFASANVSQMQAAEDAGRISGTEVTFATNRLVLIVPADNPANILSLHDLATPGIKLVLAAPAVPVRDYTDAMLDKLAADPYYGADYRAAVLANLVSEEDNVRQVTAKVALGEADAGIVYRSDVTRDIADEVIALAIADDLNTVATYPIAITDDASEPEAAQAFVDFVLADAGQDILVKWGLTSIRIPDCTANASADASADAPADATAEALPSATCQPDLLAIATPAA